MGIGKIVKIVIGVVLGYFALNVVLGILNIALALVMKILIIGGLSLLVVYGYKQIKEK